MELSKYLKERQAPDGIFWEDPRTPDSLTPGSHVKVSWRCSGGHRWIAPVYSVVLDGCGCPYCSGRLAVPGQTDLATVAPELAQQWDREKNLPIVPENVLPSSHEKVWWRCVLGHSWQAAPFSRTGPKGSGCPYCTGKKVLPGFNDLATLKPGVAEQWHPTLNGMLSPRQLSPGSNRKVWWRCGEHHVWQAAVYARTRKNASGCPVCAGTVKAPPMGKCRHARCIRKQEPTLSTVSPDPAP